MCRLLAVKRRQPFDIGPRVRSLARIAEHSSRYQGHGWGCAWLDHEGRWRMYKNIRPIWEDDLSQFAQTTCLLAHARSAFRDEGITIENNMPFHDEHRVFIFNGELHGVRIREEGRIGAEKIFNFVRRLARDDLEDALRRAVDIIQKRCRLVRSMNIILADERAVHVSSLFNDDPDYFTMHERVLDDGFIICSEPCLDEQGWRPIANGSVRTYR